MELGATFEIVNWDEKPVQEWDGGKLTRARVTKRYAGDVEGDAVLEGASGTGDMVADPSGRVTLDLS